jgi:hypothetical protein
MVGSLGDKRTRELFRSGNYEGWHAALLRSGNLDLYKEPCGPPSILTAKCANEECEETLEWSNCSYCVSCHDDDEHGHCVVEDGVFGKFCAEVINNELIPSTAPSCNTHLANIDLDDPDWRETYRERVKNG